MKQLCPIDFIGGLLKGGNSEYRVGGINIKILELLDKVK